MIDRLAATGDDTAVDLPATRLTHRDRNAPDREGGLDFSFSGVTFLPLGGTEEDPQLWGLEFRIRQSDGRVLPDSFRCYLAWEGW